MPSIRPSSMANGIWAGLACISPKMMDDIHTVFQGCMPLRARYPHNPSRKSSSSAMGATTHTAIIPHMLRANFSSASSIRSGSSAISVIRLVAKAPHMQAAMAANAHPHLIPPVLKASGIRITFSFFQHTRMAATIIIFMTGAIIGIGMPLSIPIPVITAIRIVAKPVINCVITK